MADKDAIRKCGNCYNRCWYGYYMVENCMDYEMATTEEEEIETAKHCPKYEYGTPDCLNDEDYCPSSTNGDYSPSNPWDAPGMSIKDFI